MAKHLVDTWRTGPRPGNGRTWDEDIEGKIPDLLIAAAEEAGLAVLHSDADCDLIAETTGLRCDWVVPAGSIP
jgi:hypothetical protein